MKIQKMKVELENIIEEMIQDKKECGNDVEASNEMFLSWDAIVKEYREIANYISKFAETEEEIEIVKTMRTLHYVRCYGIRPADAQEKLYKEMENDDSGGIW